MLLNLEDLVKFKEVFTQEGSELKSSLVVEQLEKELPQTPGLKNSMLVHRGYFDEHFSVQSENMRKNAHIANSSFFLNHPNYVQEAN